MPIDPSPPSGPVEDLLHKEVDGCATPEERRRLREILANDPAAREELASLREMSAFLSGSPSREVPADLRRRVLEALPPLRPARDVGGSPDPSSPAISTAPRVPGGRRVLALAWAAAAGLAVGVVLGPWMMGRPAPQTGAVDPTRVSGALIPQPGEAERAPVASASLPVPGGEVRAVLSADDEGGAVEIAHAGDAELLVGIRVDPDQVAIAGFAREGEPVDRLMVTTDQVRWRMRRGSRVSIHCERLSSSATRVEVMVRAEGAAPITSVLDWPEGSPVGPK